MTGAKPLRGLLAAMVLSFAALGILSVDALARTNHALLVAVTAYPNLPPKAALIGPNHDARLVREYLTTAAPVPFAAANVVVLADGIEGAAGSPTHEAILAQLKNLADTVQRDDFVYLHFSGHGAQQPETAAGNETDGLDEIFLPADTGKWANREKGVPNALMDDEIGAALDAIRDKGAFVWFVIDACHSGSATRAADIGDDVVAERKLDFETLGIPAEEVSKAEASATQAPAERQAAFSLTDEKTGEGAARAFSPGTASPTSAAPLAKGGLVAFFAAQTIETTPEMPLPKGEPQAERYGLFTYTLFSKLAENPGATYRQLGHAVLQQYSADRRERPTPLFEGDLDARAFDSEQIDTVMQWPVTVEGSSATVPAGSLHRLSKGTKLAILPSPTSKPEEALGYLEVSAARSLSSKLAPVAYEGKPAMKLADLPENAYARLAEVSVDYMLTVARPSPVESMVAAVKAANQMLDALARDDQQRFRIRLVDPGAEADLRLAVWAEKTLPGASSDASAEPALWFLPPSGEIKLDSGSKPPSVTLDAVNPGETAKKTAENLLKIFRATALSRLAAASDYSSEDVSVQFRIKRDGQEELEPLQASSVPILNPGDQIHVLAENASSDLVDINILYVGSDYSIRHMDAQRLVAGAKVEEGILEITDESFGMERIIAVLTEAPPLSEVEDLKFLEQDGVLPATRGVSQASFGELLDDIGLAPSTRSAAKLGDKNKAGGAVMIFPIETRPRS
ncbi:caspase family protein [Corticibacterium sp. UT-5YL-CI-8]|nr:caspase family protein [Tianweitania sp. UT-5YL-CI-8]